MSYNQVMSHYGMLQCFCFFSRSLPYWTTDTCNMVNGTGRLLKFNTVSSLYSNILYKSKILYYITVKPTYVATYIKGLLVFSSQLFWVP